MKKKAAQFLRKNSGARRTFMVTVCCGMHSSLFFPDYFFSMLGFFQMPPDMLGRPRAPKNSKKVQGAAPHTRAPSNGGLSLHGRGV